MYPLLFYSCFFSFLYFFLNFISYFCIVFSSIKAVRNFFPILNFLFCYFLLFLHLVCFSVLPWLLFYNLVWLPRRNFIFNFSFLRVNVGSKFVQVVLKKTLLNTAPRSGMPNWYLILSASLFFAKSFPEKHKYLKILL